MISAYFTGEKVHSSSSQAFSLFEKSRFGEKRRSNIEYSFVEALYLVDTGKMQVTQNSKDLDFNMLLKKFRKFDKRIELKFLVYADMRDRGYILKTALKFGADFRVYKKGIKPGQDHAVWILYCVPEYETHSWHEFAAKNRVAHSTNKKLLLAILDDEDDVTYYEVGWLQP